MRLRRNRKWPYQDLRSRWQRGKHGYAPSDVWGLDTYLAGVIAGSLEYLADNAHGHPMDMTEESWPEWLRETAALFRVYAEGDDLNDLAAEEAARSAVSEGLVRLAWQWGNLWD